MQHTKNKIQVIIIIIKNWGRLEHQAQACALYGKPLQKYIQKNLYHFRYLNIQIKIKRSSSWSKNIFNHIIFLARIYSYKWIERRYWRCTGLSENLRLERARLLVRGIFEIFKELKKLCRKSGLLYLVFDTT